MKSCHERSTLTNKVCRMQMCDNGNMEDHINVMMDIVDQLEALGEKLKNDLVVTLLLCSLQDSYDNLITALESRKDEYITLEMVKAKLISEYIRRTEIEGATSSIEGVLKASRKTTVICYKCNKSGHFQRNCPLLANGQGNSAKVVTRVETAKAISGSKNVQVSDESDDDGEVNYCFMMSGPIKRVGGVTSHNGKFS